MGGRKTCPINRIITQPRDILDEVVVATDDSKAKIFQGLQGLKRGVAICTYGIKGK